jgi:hypothetical protein
MAYAQWNPQANYLAGDIVYDGINPYTAVVNNTAQQPSLNTPAVWILTNPPATPVVDSLNGLQNAVVLVAGSGTSVTPGLPAAQDITIANTGVLSVGAGAGISSTGGQNPSIANTGVLSVDGATGAVTTRTGQYYKTAVQNLTSGNTDATFDVAQSWTDTTAVTWTAGSANFTVATKGLYQLEFSVTILANGATWLTTSNKGCSIDITRSPIAEQIIVANNAQMASGINYAQMVVATLALEVGDIINCRVANTFTGGPSQIQSLQNTFDYNTTFTWTLLKTLP